MISSSTAHAWSVQILLPIATKNGNWQFNMLAISLKQQYALTTSFRSSPVSTNLSKAIFHCEGLKLCKKRQQQQNESSIKNALLIHRSIADQRNNLLLLIIFLLYYHKQSHRLLYVLAVLISVFTEISSIVRALPNCLNARTFTARNSVYQWDLLSHLSKISSAKEWTNQLKSWVLKLLSDN